MRENELPKFWRHLHLSYARANACKHPGCYYNKTSSLDQSPTNQLVSLASNEGIVLMKWMTNPNKGNFITLQ